MKRFVLSFIVMSLFFTGCANHHEENRKAAQDRWEQSRTKFAMRIARQQFSEGQTEKAFYSVQKILKDNPDHGPANLLLGKIYLELNQPNPALKVFLIAQKAMPEESEAAYQVGTIYENQGKMDKAIKHYQIAWKRSPDNITYLLTLTETLTTQNDQEAAMTLLKEKIKEGTSEMSVYIAAGNLLMSQKKYQEAAEMFQMAITNQPDNLQARESLAMALFYDNQSEKAAGHLLQLKSMAEIAKNKKSDTPPYQFKWPQFLALGDCHMQLGQIDKARECFDYVSQHDTSNPAIWVRLAKVALLENDPQKAGRYADKALILSPGFADAIIVQGYLAIKDQDYPLAETKMRLIIDADKQNSLAWCLLGQALHEQGKAKEAAKCYAQALRVNPNDPIAKHLMIATDSKIISQ
ncbi:MAG: tetratricopeptide repeat protein [Phycisphaerae bacterium]|nr:tetratricopeptide repeat protein [Phycisphaerae bacterium]